MADLVDAPAAAAALDAILPARLDGKARTRRDVYRLLPALPPGIVVRLPGRVYIDRERLVAWILAGGLAASSQEHS